MDIAIATDLLSQQLHTPLMVVRSYAFKNKYYNLIFSDNLKSHIKGWYDKQNNPLDILNATFLSHYGYKYRFSNEDF